MKLAKITEQTTTVSDIMTKKVVTSKPGETVSKVIAKIEQHHVKEIPITDEKSRVVGMISLDRLLDIKAPSRMKVDKVIFQTPHADPGQSIDELIKTMAEAGLEALPVTREDKIVGIVSEYDILEHLLKTGFIQKYAVRDWMKTSFPTIKPDDELEKAKRLMRHYNVGALPIINERGKYHSTIFLTDILTKTFIQSQKMGRGDYKGETMPLLESRVVDLSRTEVPVVSPKHEITEALKRMLDNRMKSIIVTEKNKPVGVLRRRDVLYRVAKEFLQKGVMVEFSGLELDWEVLSRLKDLISEHVRKIFYFQPFERLKVHVKAVHDIERERYEIKLRAISPGDSYSVKQEGWDVYFTMENALRQLEAVVRKEYE